MSTLIDIIGDGWDEHSKRVDSTLLMNIDKYDVCKNNEIAALFAECYQHIIRYNRTAKEWYWYNGKRWEIDTGGCYAQELAKQFYPKLYKAICKKWDKQKNESDDYTSDDDVEKTTNSIKRKDAEFKNVGKLHTLSARKTLLEDARSVYPFSTEELDTDIYILNCQNGTLDLRTGNFHDHCPDDMLSDIAGVDYNPTVDCPRFKRFLAEIFSNPTGDGYEERPEVAEFVQTACGYALTGNVSQDCLFIAYGATSRNGKTTLMESIMHVMGTYACTAKPDTLAYTGKPNAQGASEDVARLKGKRFVNISEPQKSLHLDVAKVKDLTGGGTQVARRLHENSFEFSPTFKFFINTNYLPRVTDDTLFTSGRVYVIPFERHFTPEERDRDLLETLKEEGSGILNWLIEGLNKFNEKRYLEAPQAIIDAVKAYQEESDKIGQFWKERMKESSFNSKGGKVYKAYCDWCAESNIHPQSKGLFFDDLRKRGLMMPCQVDGQLDKNGVKGYEPIDVWAQTTGEDYLP